MDATLTPRPMSIVCQQCGASATSDRVGSDEDIRLQNAALAAMDECAYSAMLCWHCYRRFDNPMVYRFTEYGADDGDNCWDCGESTEDNDMDMCTRCGHTICDDDKRDHQCGRERVM